MAAILQYQKIVMRRALVTACAFVVAASASMASPRSAAAEPSAALPDSACGLYGLQEVPMGANGRAWNDRDGDVLTYQGAATSDVLPDLSSDKALRDWGQDLAKQQGGALIEVRRAAAGNNVLRLIFETVEAEAHIYTGVCLIPGRSGSRLWVLIAREHDDAGEPGSDPLSKVRRVLDVLPCPALTALAKRRPPPLVVDTTGLNRPRGPGEPPAFGDYVYVEELPEAVVKVPPSYPDEAMKQRVDGTVMVQALVGLDGSVLETKVVKSIPLLDAAAQAAVRQWRFKPALAKGKPVSTWVAVPIRFTLN